MKETIFENEYLMSTNLIKEYVYKVLCKKIIIMGFIITILGIIMFLVMNDEKSHVMLAVAFIAGASTLATPIMTIKQIEENGKKLNNGKIEKTNVKFSENIVMNEGKAHLEFEYTQIIDVVETKNLIVLKISSQTAILVSKDGFLIGNNEGFISFIKGKLDNKISTRKNLKNS